MDDRNIVTLFIFLFLLVTCTSFAVLIWHANVDVQQRKRLVFEEIETDTPLPKGDHNVTVNRSDFTYSW